MVFKTPRQVTHRQLQLSDPAEKQEMRDRQKQMLREIENHYIERRRPRSRKMRII